MSSFDDSQALFVWKHLNGVAFRHVASSAFIEQWRRLPMTYRSDYMIRAKRIAHERAQKGAFRATAQV